MVLQVGKLCVLDLPHRLIQSCHCQALNLKASNSFVTFFEYLGTKANKKKNIKFFVHKSLFSGDFNRKKLHFL